MKNYIVACGFAFAGLVTTAARADHTSDNSSYIASLAYHLADTAEAMEEHAREDAGGGWGPDRAGEVAKDLDVSIQHEGQQPANHREECLIQMSYAARRLHLAASDLYRAARWDGNGPFVQSTEKAEEGGGSQIMDHRGDNTRLYYDRVRMEFANVRNVYGSLSPYSIDQHIHILFRDIVDAYNNLEWYVYGVRP